MNNQKIKIVFLGSGPVAAKSLQLLAHNFEVEAVITKQTTFAEMDILPTRPPVYAVNSRSELDALISNTNFSSSVAILIDFGIIVSQEVIDSFEKGIINSHFSLLPEWRGADPITFSILSGQEKTGVSLMLIDSGMDTGKLIAQKSLKLDSTLTNTELTNQLIKLSNEMLATTLPKYLKNEVKVRSQPHPYRATYSRKLTKADGVLNFNKPADQLEKEIRAYNVWPKSRTQLAGKDVVIVEATVDSNSKGKVGSVFVTEDKKIGIQTSKGALIIEALKPAGKNTMSAESFLAGYGDKL